MLLADLEQRANILHRSAHNKDIVLYEDHRYLLNVLYFARRNNIITVPINLVRFDNHDDALANTISTNRLDYFRDFRPDLNEFWSFVEFELSVQDDNWLTVGCDLGLIGEMVLIGGETTGNILNAPYHDKFNNDHHFYAKDHIWDALQYQGWLSDTARANEFRPIWNLFGWDHQDGHFKFTNEPQYVLDFDLDCFTLSYNQLTTAIPEEIFYTLLGKRSNARQTQGWTAAFFIKELVKNSQFVTLCYENKFCGGLRNAMRILEVLDSEIFDSSIL